MVFFLVCITQVQLPAKAVVAQMSGSDTHSCVVVTDGSVPHSEEGPATRSKDVCWMRAVECISSRAFL